MTSINIYNTLTKKVEPLKPFKGKRVNLFVCGPTVYDFPHIGHARTYIIFDCFAKYLTSLGFTVFYLQNITNIDDKIIARAREKGVSPKDLAAAFEKEHLKDMKLIGVTAVTKYAKATQYIKQIISQIKRLMDKGYAYRLNDGIYFDISKFKNYGKLSGRSVLQAEDSVSRIDYSANKKNRGDFCLWKFSIEGEPSWSSPFGKGRPGWHIEDTAITEKFFGEQYDIHGGARDLIFPHHEAEIAQMEAISEKRPLAKYWMHTGFLTIHDQKMSKSLDNSLLITQFLQRYSAEHLRFWIARNLWSSPMNYSESTMVEIRSALEKMEEFLRKIVSVKQPGVKSKEIIVLVQKAKEQFHQNLRDNFNTPRAFAVLFELMREVNTLVDQNPALLNKKSADLVYKFFTEVNIIFGIIDLKKLRGSSIPDEVKRLVKQREQYRKISDWQRSDLVRAEIEKYGYSIEDTKEGPQLKKLHQ